MKSVKFIFNLVAFAIFSFSAQGAMPTTGSFVIPSTASADNPTVSKKQQEVLFMKWFVALSPKEYGKMRGKKLNIFEKASFKLTQYRMKQQLRANRRSNEGEGVNWGGLALGAFLGLIGVVGAYVFSKDNNFIKWTWIGCGIFLVWFLIFVL